MLIHSWNAKRRPTRTEAVIKIAGCINTGSCLLDFLIVL
jgi:hypothetical protein